MKRGNNLDEREEIIDLDKLIEIGDIDETAAKVLTELHDSANEGRGNHNFNGSKWLKAFGYLSRVRKIRRGAEDLFLSRAHGHFVLDRW